MTRAALPRPEPAADAAPSCSAQGPGALPPACLERFSSTQEPEVLILRKNSASLCAVALISILPIARCGLLTDERTLDESQCARRFGIPLAVMNEDLRSPALSENQKAGIRETAFFFAIFYADCLDSVNKQMKPITK